MPSLPSTRRITRRYAVLERSTEETVDKIVFRHETNFSYVIIKGTEVARLSLRQFKLFKYLAAHKKQGFFSEDLFRTVFTNANAAKNCTGQLRKTIKELNRKMRGVPGYTPVFMLELKADTSAWNEIKTYIGMANRPDEITLPETHIETPLELTENSDFVPKARGKDKMGKPIYKDTDFFDVRNSFTLLDMGLFKIQINNASKTGFVREGSIAFTAAETTFLLRIWYTSLARDAVKIRGAETPAADLAKSLNTKLAKINPERVNMIQPIAGSYGFACRPIRATLQQPVMAQTTCNIA